MDVFVSKRAQERLKTLGRLGGLLVRTSAKSTLLDGRQQLNPLQPAGPNGEPRYWTEIGGGFTIIVRVLPGGYFVEDFLSDAEIAEMIESAKRDDDGDDGEAGGE